MVNLKCEKNGGIRNESRICKMIEDGKFLQSELTNDQTSTAFLSNLYISEGKPGKVKTTFAW